jgi:hypothetical protein
MAENPGMNIPAMQNFRVYSINGNFLVMPNGGKVTIDSLLF